MSRRRVDVSLQDPTEARFDDTTVSLGRILDKEGSNLRRDWRPETTGYNVGLKRWTIRRGRNGSAADSTYSLQYGRGPVPSIQLQTAHPVVQQRPVPGGKDDYFDYYPNSKGCEPGFIFPCRVRSACSGL